MNPNLEAAILEFLGNEFHLEPQKISPDLNFQTDLNLSPDQIANLFQHMQDALNFTLPEEKTSDIATVSDLLAIIAESEEDAPAYQGDQ